MVFPRQTNTTAIQSLNNQTYVVLRLVVIKEENTIELLVFNLRKKKYLAPFILLELKLMHIEKAMYRNDPDKCHTWRSSQDGLA